MLPMAIRLLLLSFQHTAARRRLGLSMPNSQRQHWFQHTAARRRLEKTAPATKY